MTMRMIDKKQAILTDPSAKRMVDQSSTWAWHEPLDNWLAKAFHIEHSQNDTACPHQQSPLLSGDSPGPRSPLSNGAMSFENATGTPPKIDSTPRHGPAIGIL